MSEKLRSLVKKYTVLGRVVGRMVVDAVPRRKARKGGISWALCPAIWRLVCLTREREWACGERRGEMARYICKSVYLLVHAADVLLLLLLVLS